MMGQNTTLKTVDSLYREDQFYIGVSYNLINNKPENLTQSGLSPGIHLGFIRDMPINKNRNIALGIGLGYSANTFNHNLLINRNDASVFTYTILESDNTFNKNTFTTHLLELPFQFRWRTSTPESYTFWRIYLGFKWSYIFAHRIKYEGELGNIKFTNVDDLNKMQYGLTLNVGYGIWNLHVYYGLNPIFSSNARLNDSILDINIIKIGLMFYLL